MSIDGATGLISWTPAAAQLGPNAVVVAAADPAGASSTQSFTVNVVDNQHPPVVSAIPGQVVQDPNPFKPINLDLLVNDPDHAPDELTWAAAGASELTVSIDANRTATIGYSPGTRVTEAITFTVTDPDGLTDSATANFTVAEPSNDEVLPVLAIELGGDTVPVGGSVTLTIRAQDNEGIADISVLADGEVLPVTDLGGGVFEATFSPTGTGIHTLSATVTDLAGNQFSDQTEVLVIDPAISSSLTVAITSPAEDAVLDSKTDIAGTASGDNFADYTLQYAPNGTEDFVEFAGATTPVTGGILGTLDAGMLEDGFYTIRLTARNLGGAQSSISRVIEVQGGGKVGLFTISYQDKTLPLGRLPLTLVRTYDSRDRSKGDFGYGWKLKYNGAKIVENRDPSQDWIQNKSGGLFPQYSIQETKTHVVTVILGEDIKERFRPQVLPTSQTLLPIQFLDGMNYVKVGDSTGSLVPHQQPFYWNGGVPGPGELLDDFFELFNNSGFTYTDDNGYVYRFTEKSFRSRRYNLRSVTDPSGISLTIDSNGLNRSDGIGIGLVRDGEGRISQLNDPNGNTIQYLYDVRGDLVAVIDEDGNRTEFSYDRFHNLLEIRDPLGNRAVRAEYDEDGRLIATTDAQGHRTELTHDISGEQEIIQDAQGNVTVYGYDARGNVTSQTDALGNTTTFTYDSRGNRLSETDPLGNQRTMTYDSRGNLLTLKDAEGRTSSFTYDSSGRILTATDPSGQTMTYTYDSKGNLLTATDPLGNTTSYTYDSKNNLVSLRNSEGNVVTNQYNSAGSIIQQTDLLGNASTYSYDANGNQVSQATTRTDENGNPVTVTITKSYNGNDKLLTTVAPDGNSVDFEYNALSLPSALIDRNGNRTETQYDSVGNLTRKIFPDGTEESYTYDENRNRLTLTNRRGFVTHFEYDALGRAVATVFPDGSRTSVEYDAAGRQIAAVDANGNRRTYEFDGLGRRIREIDALGNETRTTYDLQGNVESMTDANGRTIAFSYDAVGRATETMLPDGTVVSFSYDSLGRIVSQTDQAGNTTSFDYNAAGRLVQVTDALGNSTSYDYDELGNRTSMVDAKGSVTRWAYDSQRRLIKTTLPLGMFETYTYDNTGNVLTRTDYEGNTTSFEYDSRNRLTRKIFQDGSEVSFTYTSTSQRATMTDSTGVTSYTYDSRNRLIEVAAPNGTISYTYDPVGNILSMTTPSGSVSYTYDALNRIATVNDSGGGVTSYQYDPVGNLERVDYPNGTIAQYGYDELNRLISVDNLRTDSSIITSHGYDLDPAGNRLRMTEAGGRIVDYTYDALYRLTREEITDPAEGNSSFSYTYDEVGNRLRMETSTGSVDFTYDANHRMLTSGGRTFTYDANGNLLSAEEGGGITMYGYDFENGMTSIRNSLVAIDFTYDGDGTRVKTVVNGVETRYLVDSTRFMTKVVEERDGTGTLLARYVYGHSLISQDRDGAISYYHQDALSSTRALTNSAGDVTDTYSYDAFGNLTASSGATTNSFLFNGQQLDSNSGFYYLRARYYDPENGRFSTRDPMPGDPRMPMSFHPYVYCGNNPVNCTDPTGLFSIVSVSISIAIVGILASISAQIYITAAVFYYLPNPATAFLSLPDAGMIGGQVSISPTALILRFGPYHPLTLGIAAALVFVSGLGGVELLIPKTLDRIWLYSYFGVAFGGDLMHIVRRTIGSATLGAAAFSFSGYFGAVWNVSRATDYTGHFISVSGSIVNGRFPRLPRVPGLTIFTSPAKGESYGFSVGAGGSTRGSSGGIFAAWTYYFLEAEVISTDGGLDFGDPRESTGPLRRLVNLLFGG